MPGYIINDAPGTIVGLITLIHTTTLVSEFLGNIVKGHPAQTLKVFRAGESTSGGNTPKAGTDTLTINDVLEVTAENGDVKQYTITVEPPV